MRRNLMIGGAVVALVVIALLVVFGLVIPGSTPATTTGTPALTSQFGDIKTKAKTTATTASTGSSAATSTNSAYNQSASIKLVSYIEQEPFQASAPQQDEPLFTSCTEERGATATPNGSVATAVATEAATEIAAANSAEPDYIVLSLVGEESEACYQVGEVFFNQNNRFNLAIGLTKAIAGEIAIDRANLANSKIGDVQIDISQLQSDESRRDGMIRRQWLESNNFPLAKLSEVKIVGLPSRAYVEGEVLNFQVVATLTVHETAHETIWDVKATLKDGALSGSASTDVLMTDFGFDPPSIMGMLKANNEAHLIFNFVAREPSQ